MKKKIKKCIVCDSVIKSTRRRVYCSDECYQINRKKMTAKASKKQFESGKQGEWLERNRKKRHETRIRIYYRNEKHKDELERKRMKKLKKEKPEVYHRIKEEEKKRIEEYRRTHPPKELVYLCPGCGKRLVNKRFCNKLCDMIGKMKRLTKLKEEMENNKNNMSNKLKVKGLENNSIFSLSRP